MEHGANPRSLEESRYTSLRSMGMLVQLQPVDCRLDRLTQAAEELSEGTGRKTIEKFETIDFVICGRFHLPTLSYAALIWSGLLAIGAAGNSLAHISGPGERFQYCVDIHSHFSGTLLTPGLTNCSGDSIPSKPQFPVSANDMTRTSRQLCSPFRRYFELTCV